MTREQIIALAKQCGAIDSYPGSNDGIVEFEPDQLEAFFHAAQREALTQAATIIRADKWPTPRSAYHDQYNQQIEARAKRVEQIGEIGINGLTKAETDNTMSVRGLSDKKPTAYERKCFNDWKNP